jgi:P-type Ca2+ transporter type 2C
MPLNTFEPVSLVGLSTEEAARRLAQDGPNALRGSEPKSVLRIAMGILLEPMFLMLLAAGGIYMVIGDAAEATFLLGSVFAIIALALTQQRKTQRALEALRDLSAPRALVIRDGQEQRIAGKEVVRGDLMVLHEGDRIAADAVLLQGQLSTDESLLTGEAVPQDKLPGDAGAGLPAEPADGALLFASTVVTRGVGVAQVRATGAHAAVGRIGAALASTTLVTSSLQRASRKVVRGMATIGLALATALVLLSWLWDERPLVESLLLGIALAMSILPEEIPVVLTVFLALGAWRLSQQKVLTRRVEAVEALGAITVLAVDKTGTLTLNQMQVAELALAQTSFQQNRGEGAGEVMPETFHELASFALLATPLDPFDPMEKAIRAFGHQHLAHTQHWQPRRAPVFAYPLTPQMLAVTHVFEESGQDHHLLATKGAPEAVADLCHLGPVQLEAVQAQVQEMAQRGLRVLAVARGVWTGETWPASQHELTFTYLGLVGLADPPRPDAPAAVAACRSAGIRIIMLTGDHPATARAIAGQIGLDGTAGLLTGSDIAAMHDDELRRRLVGVNLCARLAPQQKLRLVRLLQQGGDTVGMTGDGVNDAPALKAADVGIAMGQRGTDVAREAAAIVLLDDSFASITAAIRQGRRIYDNIGSATRFIFAVHVPIIALALGPVIFHWPVLLLPVQIVLLELIIDPACSVIFEAEPEAMGLMQRPPRARTASPFEPSNLRSAILQGMGLASVLLVGVWAMIYLGWEADVIRTTAFMVLVLGIMMLVLANRDLHRTVIYSATMPNRWLARMALAVVALLSLALGLPWLRQVMGLAHLPVVAWVMVALMLVLAIFWMEIQRFTWRRSFTRRSQ